MRKLVLTDQAKNDLAGLERATRLRIAAALQRLIQNNAGNIKKASRHRSARVPPFALVIGAFAFPIPIPAPSASTASSTATKLTAEDRAPTCTPAGHSISHADSFAANALALDFPPLWCTALMFRYRPLFCDPRDVSERLSLLRSPAHPRSQRGSLQ